MAEQLSPLERIRPGIGILDYGLHAGGGSSPPSMSDLRELPAPVLELIEGMLAEPVRDRRYLGTRLGPHVSAYLSWKENEAGARPRTVDSYERDLARMAVQLAAHEADQVTKDNLRAVRDSFPAGSRRRVTAVFRDFWRWMEEEDRLAGRNPMVGVRTPRRTMTTVYDIFSEEEEARLISAQAGYPTAARDRVGVLLLLRAGLRADELRHLRVDDVDLIERWVIVRRGKGGKGRVVPVRGELVRALEELMLTPIAKLGRTPERGDYLLYPCGANKMGLSWADPTRPMVYSTFWRWWSRCAERAGVRYRKPHMSRHTYATKLRRSGADLTDVQKALGHSSITSTVIYLHTDVTDVALAVEKMEREREAVV